MCVVMYRKIDGSVVTVIKPLYEALKLAWLLSRIGAPVDLIYRPR